MDAVMPARPRPALQRLATAALFLLCGATSTAAARESTALKFPNSQLEPAAWTDLDGWADDDHAAAFKTFLASCKAMLPRSASARETRPVFAALKQICHRAVAAAPGSDEAARVFFEKNFRPVRISTLGEADGFLTGYYEPIVDGSRTQTEEYNVPLYRRPSNLIAGGRRIAGDFPNKGPVGRKVGRRKIAPYYDRAEIEDGALSGRKLEICWLKDPTDAFFMQIQGSGRVRLADGAVLRLNYDAHNGWPYTPVGKFLIDRGIVPKEEMSLDRIRQWMESNPEGGKELRRLNRSFVFFRETGLSEQDEPVGAQGIPVTAGRSIAVDRAIHVYGTPFFIEADLPIESEKPTTKFRRLMVAQDTGSAIVGLARADIYFGAGSELGQIAGRIRHPGRFAMLVPNELDPAKVDRHLPLPKPRPTALAMQQKGQDAAQTNAAAKAAAIPLPPPRPKIGPKT
jgi:membrane-bound lytic murein transglycosylase A